MRMRAKVFEVILSHAAPLSNNCWYCVRTSVKYIQIGPIRETFKIKLQTYDTKYQNVFTDIIHYDLSLF